LIRIFNASNFLLNSWKTNPNWCVIGSFCNYSYHL